MCRVPFCASLCFAIKHTHTKYTDTFPEWQSLCRMRSRHLLVADKPLRGLAGPLWPPLSPLLLVSHIECHLLCHFLVSITLGGGTASCLLGPLKEGPPLPFVRWACFILSLGLKCHLSRVEFLYKGPPLGPDRPPVCFLLRTQHTWWFFRCYSLICRLHSRPHWKSSEGRDLLFVCYHVTLVFGTQYTELNIIVGRKSID